MPTWPVGLPGLDEFLRGSYVEGTPDNMLRSKVGYGPPKTREKSTAAPRPIKGRLYMTPAQVEIHDVFFVSTTNHGTTQFDTTSPRTGLSANFLYANPPVYTAVGTGYYVDIELEKLP